MLGVCNTCTYTTPDVTMYVLNVHVYMCVGPSCKSATGLMEWGDIDAALDAFVLGNHHTLFAKSGLCTKKCIILAPCPTLYMLYHLLCFPVPPSLPPSVTLLSPSSHSTCTSLASLTPLCTLSCCVYITFIYSSPPIPQTDKPTHSRWPSLPTLHWSTTLEQVVVEGGQCRVICSTCASFAMQHACIMHTYNRLDTALCNFRTTYIHTYVLPNCCVVMLFSLSINSLRYCGNSK